LGHTRKTVSEITYNVEWDVKLYYTILLQGNFDHQGQGQGHGLPQAGKHGTCPPLPSPESIKSLAPYRHVKVEKEKCMRTVGRGVRVGVLEDRAGSFLPAS